MQPENQFIDQPEVFKKYLLKFNRYRTYKQLIYA